MLSAKSDAARYAEYLRSDRCADDYRDLVASDPDYYARLDSRAAAVLRGWANAKDGLGRQHRKILRQLAYRKTAAKRGKAAKQTAALIALTRKTTLSDEYAALIVRLEELGSRHSADMPAQPKTTVDDKTCAKQGDVDDTIVDLRRQGKTFQQIADYLNNHNLPLPSNSRSETWKWYAVRTRLIGLNG